MERKVLSSISCRPSGSECLLTCGLRRCALHKRRRGRNREKPECACDKRLSQCLVGCFVVQISLALETRCVKHLTGLPLLAGRGWLRDEIPAILLSPGITRT